MFTKEEAWTVAKKSPLKYKAQKGTKVVKTDIRFIADI
jgi:hypothetical protein